MAKKTWSLEDVMQLGVSEKTAKKLLPYLNEGKTLEEAFKEINRSEVVKSKDPVGAVMANTMDKLTDIAIQRVDNGNGPPIFLLNAGGKEQTADLNTIINFLQQVIKENSAKGENPELKEMQKQIAELKDLLAKKEAEEEEDKIKELEALLNMKIADLQDAINKQHIPVGDKVDITDLFQVLNQNGTLNQILRLTEQFLKNREKQIEVQRNMSLFDKAMVLANQVDDVDKISRLLKVLKELSTPEDNYEIVPEESDE